MKIGEAIRAGVRRVAYPHNMTPNALSSGSCRVVEQTDIAEGGEPCSVSEDSYYEYVGDKINDQLLDDSESVGVDPYNTGSFDKSKS